MVDFERFRVRFGVILESGREQLQNLDIAVFARPMSTCLKRFQEESSNDLIVQSIKSSQTLVYLHTVKCILGFRFEN